MKKEKEEPLTFEGFLELLGFATFLFILFFLIGAGFSLGLRIF
jgi:hypothetical protein